ncbi:MAG: hypothetical protein Q8K71_07300 [Polaromonas sp.]|nr:hypothetical protein [Polaromonas sp.]
MNTEQRAKAQGQWLNCDSGDAGPGNAGGGGNVNGNAGRHQRHCVRRLSDGNNAACRQTFLCTPYRFDADCDASRNQNFQPVKKMMNTQEMA